MTTKNIPDPISFIRSLGGIHDAWIENFNFAVIDKIMSLRLSDINANFLGLPEYAGLTPCELYFISVEELIIDVVSHEGISISEARVEACDQGWKIQIDLRLGGGVMTSGTSIYATFKELRIVASE